MQQVKVSKAKLLTVLYENRKKHKADYEKAVVEFRRAAKVQLEETLAKIKPEDAPVEFSQALKGLYVTLAAPECYLKEYDKAIGMLEMSVESEITLTASEFSSYVEDEWQWKSKFMTLNSLYGMDRVGCTATSTSAPDIG